MREAKFRTAFFGAGYAKAAVDEFVARVLSALAAAPTYTGVTREQIRQERFSPAMFRAAYRMDDVDQWLDEAEHELAERGAL